MLKSLREYQINAINATRDALRSGLKRVIIQAPCGSGKTLMAASIVSAAKEKQKRVAFVVNRIGLVKQTSRVFNYAWLQHGIIQGSNTRFANSNIVVCSIATLARRGYPQDLDMILIDECHGATSEAYTNLIQAYKNIPIIGLTATPYSTGLGRKFEWGALFEKIVCAATISDLTKQGFLVPFDMYAPEEPDLRGVKIIRGDYDETQLGEACDKPHLVGGIVEHWLKLAKGKSTVVFATNIAHSQHITAEFIAAGISCEHIDCFSTDEERIEILARHEDGTTTVISNVGILCEGHDNPRIECMILARPTRSLIRWIQMCGRALRPFQGKDRALLIDHSGSVFRLGFPDDEHPPELNDGKKSETADAQPTEERKPHLCHNCKMVVPAGVGVCPNCGMVPVRKNKVEHEAGTLEKVERKEKFTAEEKQTLWSSALGLAEKRKRSEGWASHLYKSLTGVWPRGLQDIPCEPIKKVLDMDTHNRIAYAKSKRHTTNAGATA